MEKVLTSENRIKLYEWTLSKPINWIVLCVTCFLGFITIISAIPTNSCIQNLFFIFAGVFMSILVVFSIKRIFDNFQYLEELERGFPDDIKIFLDKTTSAPQKIIFARSKFSDPKVKRTTILIILTVIFICMVTLLTLKLFCI